MYNTRYWEFILGQAERLTYTRMCLASRIFDYVEISLLILCTNAKELLFMKRVNMQQAENKANGGS